VLRFLWRTYQPNRARHVPPRLRHGAGGHRLEAGYEPIQVGVVQELAEGEEPGLRTARQGSVLRERSGIRTRIVIEERTRAVPKQHDCYEAEDHCQRRAHPLVMYGGEHGLRS
jgi:hypothetical protein